MIRFLIISVAAIVLNGCSEFDQSTAASDSYRNDTPPWKGAKNQYMAPGWTPGDKASWESQLRTRTQAQNEYVKVN